jgi:hypothetical protein
MTARARKFIGMLGILAFLAVYAAAVSSLADHIPKHGAIQFVFYLIAGVGWGVPIFPLISWMSRGR